MERNVRTFTFLELGTLANFTIFINLFTIFDYLSLALGYVLQIWLTGLPFTIFAGLSNSTTLSGGKLSTRLYDKRDDFNFHIVNFPFLSSNIPSGPSYGVYISQLIRYARCCSHYDDFRYRQKCLVDRLLSQGYKALRLEKSFKKFYGRYQDLIEKYQRSVNAMVSDSFPGQFLFNM